MNESLTGIFYEIGNQMAQLVKYFALHDNTTSATQTISAVNLNTITVTAELGVGYRVVVYANGVMTLSPISNVLGGYGVATIGNTPTSTTAGIGKLTFSYTEGAAQTTGADVENWWVLDNNMRLGRLKDSNLTISESDAGSRTQEESDEDSPH